MSINLLLICVILLSLVFDFMNGLNDSSNVVATMISSRAYSPRVALGVTAIANFIGPFIFGVAVATTIGNEVVDSQSINMLVILAALCSAIIWDIAALRLGLPSSSSHALIGGLVGATLIGAGWQAIHVNGLLRVLLALLISPVLGFGFGWIMLRLTVLFSWNAKPSINTFFKRSQMVTGVTLALSHGTNDAQKTMGLITLALVTAGYQKVFIVPNWVIFICATAIAVGTFIGGWSLIRTLGAKIFKIRPIDGFTSQLASTTVILGASLLGGPVSTTQVVSSSIMGVGAAERMNKVRWGVARDIGIAWVLTIPISALLGAGIYWVLSLFIHLA
jgi:inorganic phosphate transporter, PiT family